MNNFGRLYRFELKKIFCRKLTVIALAGILAILTAVNVTEYVMAAKAPECSDDKLVGRSLDDSLFDEMRKGITPNIVTDALGAQKIESVTYNDGAYRDLFQYLLNCFGNNTRAYSATEDELTNTFSEIIDHAYEEDKLSPDEISYWEERRASAQIPPLYGKCAGWSNSLINLYMANFFILVTVGATVSGLFAEEYSLRTDAVVFASKDGRKKLSVAKMLAGCSAGLAEAVCIILINSIVQFALQGPSDRSSSVQLVYGPTVMDMPAEKAFLLCSGIMLLISLFYSLLAMFVSQLFRNIAAPLALLSVLLICSMFNPPSEYRLVSQLASYFPATFPGSWTFTDYKLLGVFGMQLNILQVLPLLYGMLILLLAALTYRSCEKAQIKGR